MALWLVQLDGFGESGVDTPGARRRQSTDISAQHLEHFAVNMLRYGVPVTSVEALLTKFSHFVGLSKSDVEVCHVWLSCCLVVSITSVYHAVTGAACGSCAGHGFKHGVNA